ncbi:MAG: ABC transporter substrate-binding protein [Candidatus Verstraetearchaeota archaeon]|nr:ABC transporter substrate-binding protein [Candidatus Verstraetearchaeota archaeon]
MEKQGISTTLAVVAMVAMLVIGIIGGYFVAPRMEGASGGLRGEILIGAPLPLSGVLGTYGENARVALELAQSEINSLLNATNAGYSIKILFEDTETKADVALQKVQTLAAKGCKVMLGLYSSAEVRNCKTYADTNKILLISPSSTAPDLAIPNDYIFRFCPSDDKQGPAMAMGMYSKGIRYIICMWRGDTYGDGLVNATKTRFQQLGGSYSNSQDIRYNQDAKEFSTEVATLANYVQTAVSTYGADQVAVYAVTFEEITAIMSTASQYPILSQVKWFGCDGSALSQQLTDDPVAAAFAVQVNFDSTYFAPAESDNLIKVRNYIQQRLGRTADPYAYGIYDELYVVVKAMSLAGKYDAEAIQKLILPVAEVTFGASGLCTLNAAGDRNIADYEFWAPYQVNATTYSWYKSGVYTATSDSVTWLSPP